MAEPSTALIQRAQAGDGDALSVLVQSQQTYVYSIAMSLMHNPADAADMTQEAFVRLLRSIGTYRGETKFTTWLYRLVTNICLDGLRRRGRPVDSLDEPASTVTGEEASTAGERLADSDRWTQPEEEVALRESADEVRDALRSLPAAQRLALTLHYFEDLRYEDIAESMGLPLNTVKSHIRRGKERLALALSNPTEEQPCSA
ncbi:MAG TPA: sigma-70 family RNA polymerase sigma factor [Chloroflexota bacterium]